MGYYKDVPGMRRTFRQAKGVRLHVAISEHKCPVTHGQPKQQAASCRTTQKSVVTQYHHTHKCGNDARSYHKRGGAQRVRIEEIDRIVTNSKGTGALSITGNALSARRATRTGTTFTNTP